MSRIQLVSGFAALAAAAAFAQAQTSNPGFFQPKPDGETSLTKIEAPKETAALAVATDMERIEAERVAALRKAREAELKLEGEETIHGAL